MTHYIYINNNKVWCMYHDVEYHHDTHVHGDYHHDSHYNMHSGIQVCLMSQSWDNVTEHSHY